MIYRQKSKKSKSIKKAMKTKTNMKNIIRGVIFCALWYFSIIAGFFLLVCPILPLVIISPKKYRKWSDLVFGMWEPFPVAIMEVCFGIRVRLTGDKINPFEGSLFIMNHRTRVDWNFLWLGLFHCCQPNAHNIKYTLKAPIRHLPGIGWVMQTCSFIFLYRDWSRDKEVLDQMIGYLNESDNLYQILLFPEGTDITERTIKKSHKYADDHNLPRYYYVLHPRTTGFIFLVNKMKSGGQLRAIYDVTVAYPKTMPLTEVDLLRGKFPEEVHFNVKRYSTSDIPTEEEGLKSWLLDIWLEKEQKLKDFYATGSFNTGQSDTSFNSDTDQNVDFGKTSLKNGVIKMELEENEVPASSVPDEKGSVSNVEENIAPIEASSSKIPEEKECEKIEQTNPEAKESRFKNYRPPHLLYVVLVFWVFLILFTFHQLVYNFYLQIWVLTHSLLFAALSFISNGFHHLAASVYFYRYKRKEVLEKKRE